MYCKSSAIKKSNNPPPPDFSAAKHTLETIVTDRRKSDKLTAALDALSKAEHTSIDQPQQRPGAGKTQLAMSITQINMLKIEFIRFYQSIELCNL